MTSEGLQLLNPTKSKRVEAGARAKQRGDRAEDAVERLHENDFFRVSNPGVKLTRRHAKTILVEGKLRQIAPQGPDFGGGGPAKLFRYAHDGIGAWVELEVKFVDSLSNPRLDFSRFTPAEFEILSACRKAGGIAIVLVLYGPSVATARWCAIPWGALEQFVADQRAKQLEVEQEVPKERRRFAGAPASINGEAILRYAVKSFDYLRSPHVGPGR
jgi:hypothetical protein